MREMDVLHTIEMKDKNGTSFRGKVEIRTSNKRMIFNQDRPRTEFSLEIEDLRQILAIHDMLVEKEKPTSGKIFQRGDGVKILREGGTFGRKALVDRWEDGKYKVSFDPEWGGYYTAEELELI